MLTENTINSPAKTPGQDPRVRGLRVFPSEHLQSQAAERAVCGAPGPVQIEDH